MQDYEKIAAFYLGKRVEPGKDEPLDELLLYDAKDLTTHAVCVGMTGSGKTGLCLSLLEEAAIDGIPTIAIDPKGDLGNLLLSFPSLAPGDFEPWIDEGEATRKGLDKKTYAEQTAQQWREGLASWGQPPERIRRMREAADFAIYTPGSSAGLPLSILSSFAAPPPALRDNTDALRDRVESAVSGLLGLLGVQADSIQSREHILLANLLYAAWTDGRNLDLGSLIAAIQKPPFSKLGVIDLESFYPEKDRFALAMRLNNLLASPGFSSWMEGEPLDIQRLLWTPEGKPRVSILSTAHLGDSERMFFTTLLLGELIAWMRAQPGTSSLRAIFYMDEIFGYFPPTANPPSKTPMLTLLKQARAYGLGCVLATQNPVDLDYKGLSNTGTWFIGRLQTERDRNRLLDGLEGASGEQGSGFNRREMDTLISNLGKRVFLMNNVHDNAPTLFQTRWVMSYLRGPLTRTQIETLMAGRKSPAPTPASIHPPTTPSPAHAAAPAPSPQPSDAPPALPSGVHQFYIPTAQPVAEGKRLLYRPELAATARLHFVSAAAKVDTWQTLALGAPLPGAAVGIDWEEQANPIALSTTPAGPAGYAELPPHAQRAASFARWEKELASRLYQEHSLMLWKCGELKAVSEPGESEGDFRVRLRQLARERQDGEVEKLRTRYATKLRTLQDRIRRTQDRVERNKEQLKTSALSTAISIGSTLLGALFGRKVASVGNVSRAGTAMRSAGRSASKKSEVARIEEELAIQREQLQAMEEELSQQIEQIHAKFQVDGLAFEELLVRPRKSDIAIAQFGLAWRPFRVDPQGFLEPA